MSKFLKFVVLPYFTEEMIFKAFMQYRERPISVHLVDVKAEDVLYLIEFPNKIEAERVFKKLNKNIIKGIIPAHYFTFEKDEKESEITSNIPTDIRESEIVEVRNAEITNTTEADGENSLKPITATSIMPQRIVKNTTNYLNYGTNEREKHEIFVHVGRSVTQIELHAVFAKMFRSTISARVICDRFRRSKRYGFVEFASEIDQQEALKIKDGHIRIRGGSINIRDAHPKKYKQDWSTYKARNGKVLKTNTVNIVHRTNNLSPFGTVLRKSLKCADHSNQLTNYLTTEAVHKNKMFKQIKKFGEEMEIFDEEPTTSSKASYEPKVTSVLFFKGFTERSEETLQFTKSINVNMKSSSNEHLIQTSKLNIDWRTTKSVANVNELSNISFDEKVKPKNTNSQLVDHVNDGNSRKLEVQPIICQSNEVHSDVQLFTQSNSDLEKVTTDKTEKIKITVDETIQHLATVDHNTKYQHHNSIDPLIVKEGNEEGIPNNIDETNKIDKDPTVASVYCIQLQNQRKISDPEGVHHFVTVVMVGIIIIIVFIMLIGLEMLI
ncbi:uncharacterized protein LOC119678790 [Teleopsis dalmanni]|uniref:uncharacterized protein LOC119678790 n=1 Tax=Teleopsis dalmanni TaxID=139649 RepID=UPI000D32C9EF|nr:uncharacterized protein LOC119678790 [Teleopsis dalmanni]